MENANKNKLGKKEQEVLAQIPKEGIWQQDLIDRYVSANRYLGYFLSLLYRLESKGLIRITQEQNPETGRMKKKIYRLS